MNYRKCFSVHINPYIIGGDGAAPKPEEAPVQEQPSPTEEKPPQPVAEKPVEREIPTTPPPGFYT